MSGLGSQRRIICKEMEDDTQLLARYRDDGSEEAFAELLRRHLNFVFSAALRQVRNVQDAEDVTQMVFTHLSQKAGSIPRGVVLAGWLHRDARFTALNLLRGRIRSSFREQEACSVSEQPTPAIDWENVRRFLDELLNRLSANDRDALLLRFFEQRSFKDVGAALQTSEEAARKRVDRALVKLRQMLNGRGIPITESTLGAALVAHGVQSAPLPLSAAVLAGAMNSAGAPLGASIVARILNTVVMSKIKVAAISAVIVALVAGQFAWWRKAQADLEAARRSLAGQEARIALLQAENERLSNLKAARLPPAEASELLRLRNEVSQLRREKQESPRATSTTPQTVKANTSGNFQWPVGQFLPKNEWRDVGFGSPEAAAQTLFWALLNTNGQRMLQGMVVPGTEAVPPEDVLQKAMIENARPFLLAEGATLDVNETVSADEVRLRIRKKLTSDQAPGGTTTTIEDLLVRRQGDEWKIVPGYYADVLQSPAATPGTTDIPESSK